MRKVLFILPFLIISCKSTPDWIKSYPNDEDYYTAVGYSNTGDREKDTKQSYKNALKLLSSELSVIIENKNITNRKITVENDIRFTKHEVKDYTILTTFNKIRDIEVFDTYYSTKDGQWTYIRLKKSNWEKHESKEALKLELFIESKINEIKTISGVKLDKLDELLAYIGNDPFGYTINTNYYEEILKYREEIINNSNNFRVVVDNNSDLLKLDKEALIRVFEPLISEKNSINTIKIIFRFFDYSSYFDDLRASKVEVTYIINENVENQKSIKIGSYKGVGLDLYQAQSNAYSSYMESINLIEIIDSMSKL